MTRWTIFLVASGQAFFAGIACLVAAVAMSRAAMSGRSRIARNGLAGVGGVLVAASATPLPIWGYVGLALVSLAWMVGEAIPRRLPARAPRSLRIACAGAWLVAGMVEAPHHLMPRIPGMSRPVLGVIGDSVTAGTGEPEIVTWPRLLADRRGVVVRDHAAAGATVASALKQARALGPEERLVLLEIGGNDLLGGASAEDFEAGLRRLLAAVVRPGRLVAMLELPLPPGYHGFGRAQRRLAREFGVILVPNRVLLGVLLGGGATLDSIHLAQPGHEAMAAAIWDALKGAYAADGSPGG